MTSLVDTFMEGLPPVDTEASRLLTRYAALLAQPAVTVEANGGLDDYTLVIRRIKRLLDRGEQVTWCEERIREICGAVRARAEAERLSGEEGG